MEPPVPPHVMPLPNFHFVDRSHLCSCGVEFDYLALRVYGDDDEVPDWPEPCPGCGLVAEWKKNTVEKNTVWTLA